MFLYLYQKKMKTYKDMTDQQFHNLLVREFVDIKNKNARWLCECTLCGNKTVVTRPNLLSGNTKDCGCRRSQKISDAVSKHRMKDTPTYSSWSKMKQRIKKGAKHSKIYGQINLDERWLKFENFYEDMGERPPGHTIDRIDNTKGYYKENCKWSTQAEQNRNRSNNVRITFNGKTQCMTDWANELGIHRNTIRRRLKRGLPIEKVLQK